MPERAKESYCIHSVENALALLEALCEEEGGLSLSSLSARLGLSKASVFRLMSTFESRGYVERRKGEREYQLGLAAFEVGQRLLSRMALLRQARPVMGQLVRDCDEAVYLVVERQEEALFLDMVDNLQQVKVVSLVGRRFALGACAAGRILLAFSPRSPATQAQGPDEETLAKIRREGAALDCHGVGEGSACAAVPLFDGRRRIAGALALVGPAFRMTQEKITDELLPPLRTAGEVISSKLGLFSPPPHRVDGAAAGAVRRGL